MPGWHRSIIPLIATNLKGKLVTIRNWRLRFVYYTIQCIYSPVFVIHSPKYPIHLTISSLRTSLISGKHIRKVNEIYAKREDVKITHIYTG